MGWLGTVGRSILDSIEVQEELLVEDNVDRSNLDSILEQELSSVPDGASWDILDQWNLDNILEPKWLAEWVVELLGIVGQLILGSNATLG